MPANAPPPLHELEAEVMEQLWERGESSVRDVMRAINVRSGKDRAYTTYMTIMARLHRKGVLDRRREGKTDLYKPTETALYRHNQTPIHPARRRDDDGAAGGDPGIRRHVDQLTVVTNGLPIGGRVRAKRAKQSLPTTARPKVSDSWALRVLADTFVDVAFIGTNDAGRRRSLDVTLAADRQAAGPRLVRA